MKQMMFQPNANLTLKAVILLGVMATETAVADPAAPETTPSPSATATLAPQPQTEAHSAQPVNAAISARISTLGLGLEGSYLATPNVALRLGYNGYSYSHTETYQGVNYDGKLKLSSVSALADFYPSEHSGFHVSAGFLINNNKLTAHGKPDTSSSGQTFTLNGNTYNVTNVGGLDGRVNFSKTSPYLGIGFGKPSEGGAMLRFLFDLGVVFQGKPSLSLTRNGGTTDPTLSSQIDADINAQQAKTQSDVNKFQYYPVVSFGIAYHF